VALELGLYATMLGRWIRPTGFDYIERFYNPRHRHSTFGQVSPDEFEKVWRGLG
jgi:transposase InsO family protein